MFEQAITTTRRFLVLSALLMTGLLAGCQSELYSSLSERQANEIIQVLSEIGIPATRSGTEPGSYSVQVDRSNFSQAISELSSRGLPRKDFESLGQVFSSDKLVSTPFEERARFMHALNEELSSSISRIAGVASARVHLMVPESSPFDKSKINPRASVFIYKSKDANLAEQVPTIKNLIVNSMDGLQYENVEVAMFDAQGSVAAGRGIGLSGSNGVLTQLFGLLVLCGLLFGGWRLMRVMMTPAYEQNRVSKLPAQNNNQRGA